MMERTISVLFEEAIIDDIKLKMNNIYMSVNMSNNLYSENNQTKKHTIITEDTTISKDAEIKYDLNIFLLKNFQTYLLHANQLLLNTLQQIFNSKLAEKKYKVHSVIFVNYENNTEIIGDSAQFRVSYSTPVIKGGILDEITYQAKISYTPLIVFRLMSKNAIFALLFIELLILVVICYLNIEKRKIKPDKIIKKGKYYYIGETIFKVHKMELISDSKTIKLPKQQYNILMMFLENDDYEIDKSKLMELFWGKSIRSKESMMSAIAKLRNFLNEADCTFNVITKNCLDFYSLEYEG